MGNRPTPNEAETYDAAGDLLTLKSSNSGGASDTYTYDQLNRLGTVTDAFGATTYAYDAVGNLQNFTYPNGVTHAYSYDTLNRLTQVGAAKNSSSLSNYAYTLGTAGNRLTVAELSGRTVNYGYDSLYRLTSEAVTSDPNNYNGTTSYMYDAVGNRGGRAFSAPVDARPGAARSTAAGAASAQAGGDPQPGKKRTATALCWDPLPVALSATCLRAWATRPNRHESSI